MSTSAVLYIFLFFFSCELKGSEVKVFLASPLNGFHAERSPEKLKLGAQALVFCYF